jgi:hypothetical protein
MEFFLAARAIGSSAVTAMQTHNIWFFVGGVVFAGIILFSFIRR